MTDVIYANLFQRIENDTPDTYIEAFDTPYPSIVEHVGHTTEHSFNITEMGKGTFDVIAMGSFGFIRTISNNSTHVLKCQRPYMDDMSRVGTWADANSDEMIVLGNTIAEFYFNLRVLRDNPHPNLLAASHGFIDTVSCEDGPCLSLVLPYMAADLMTAIRRCRMDLPDVFNISRGILSGLHHMHNVLKYIHLDLKPPNILVNHDFSVVKISDFGAVSSRSLEQHSTEVTTLLYAAQEILLNIPTLDTSVDMFSYGYILYEMLTKTHPYDLVCRQDVYYAMNKQQILKTMWRTLGRPSKIYPAANMTSQLYSKLPPKPMIVLPISVVHGKKEFERLMMKHLHECLSYDPAYRPTASAAMNAIDQICAMSASHA